MKHKKLNKIFRYSILVSFVTFFALYLSQSTGYFEYRNSKKVALTNEQIEKFENDVKEGKNIDLAIKMHYLKPDFLYQTLRKKLFKK